MSVTLHLQTSFALSGQDGDFVAGTEHGFYFEDVRCLSCLALKLGGVTPVPLTVVQHRSDQCTYWLTNAQSDGLAPQKLLVRRERALAGGLHDEITIESYADRPVDLALTLEFDADFEDIYAVKSQAISGAGRTQEQRQAELTTQERQAVLARQIRTARCSTTLAFSRDATFEGRCVRFDVHAERGRPWQLSIDLSSRIDHPGATRHSSSATRRHDEDRRQTFEDQDARLDTDHAVLKQAYAHAAADLRALRLKGEATIEGESAIAAGIPWYMALFGRDSLIAAYQSLLHSPDLARGTLTALAHLQGQREDPASEEQPGRILHEYRKHLRASVRRNIPKFPYYGTVDATPLFLVTLSEYVRTTGDLTLPGTLWPNVERALSWIAKYGDFDGDGLVEYQTPPGGFLKNEGWKDSDDSIRFNDGRLAEQPIALVEVQGYVADAWTRTAELAEALGRNGDRLREQAAAMRRRIAERYWMDDRAAFALALDGRKRQVNSFTSNPGQLLWSRAVDPERATDISELLLSGDMFSGWGVRTMGASEGGFNPVSYHNGSVWPHDNVLFLQGLARYGRTAEVTRLAGALVDALRCEGERFPELFSGVSRSDAPRPVAYPNANVPQAWASGAVLLLVRSLLGLEVDALHARLRFSPSPLRGMRFLRLSNLPIGGARVTIALSWEGAQPRVAIDGLPPSWTWNVE